MDEPSPSGKRNEVRVFVSSTFRDMHEEREILVKHVFPQLRKLCEERGATFTEVDLRWGITEEQARQGEVLPVCMAEIDRCRPYFIGLLGERYGWVPDDIPDELIEQYPWLEQHPQRSVTELEILHGALNDPVTANRACFYFRDPTYAAQLAEDRRPDFVERAPANREKLASLKNRIRQSGLLVREDYPNPNALGQWLFEDLSQLLDQQFPPQSRLEPLDREATEHEAFARHRTRVYIGRQEYLDKLDEHVRTGEPLLVLGESGSGKSALLANWATRHLRSHPDDLVVTHFVGASSASADWAAMLRRIMGELKRRFDIRQDIPEKSDELRSAFANWLNIASAQATRGSRRAILVIDALNQLEDREGALDLAWLPPMIPSAARLFFSTLPGRPLDHLSKREWPTLTVEPLNVDERKRLIRGYLLQHTKQLSDDRVNRIVGHKQTDNPLYLSALAEELRVFGVHERLDERIDYYLAATAIDDLYARILQRYEEDYDTDGSDLVRHVMSLLWAARRGISEAELLDLLGSDGEPLPRARWSPLFLAAERSLITRGGLLGFGHDYLRRAIEVRYLASADSRQAAHRRLAEYFNVRVPGYRVFEELPWQYTQLKDWNALRSLVTHPDLTEALFDFNPTEYGHYVLLLLDRLGIDAGLLYQDFLRNPRNFSAQTLAVVHNLLRVSGALDLADALSRELVQITEEAGDPRAAGKALLLAIGSRKAIGDYDYEDLLSKAEPIFRQLGDDESLARCLAHRADFHKHHRRDLRAAIKYHQDQEKILRRIGNASSLAICLNNQAVTYGRLLEPQKALALRLEVQKISRELGDLDSIALSDSNLGVFHLQAALIQRQQMRQARPARHASTDDLSDADAFLLRFGNVNDNLREGWMLLGGAESGYRALMKPLSLAGVLRRQVEILWELVQSPFSEDVAEIVDVIAQVAIPKAREAQDLYLRFGEWRRNEVEYMEKYIDGMTRWADSARTDQQSGLDPRSLLKALGVAGDELGSPEQEVDREFARFVLQQEHRPEPDDRGGQTSMGIVVKVVKEEGGQKLWEIENCPDEVWDELDELGLIPDVGVVSWPGNTAIVPGREGEVIAYLKGKGLAFEKRETVGPPGPAAT